MIILKILRFVIPIIIAIGGLYYGFKVILEFWEWLKSKFDEAESSKDPHE